MLGQNACLPRLVPKLCFGKFSFGARRVRFLNPAESESGTSSSGGPLVYPVASLSTKEENAPSAGVRMTAEHARLQWRTQFVTTGECY